MEVYHLGSEPAGVRERGYRGHGFTIDLVPRFGIDFVLFDDDVESALHKLHEIVQPDSVSIFSPDQKVRTISPVYGHVNSLRLPIREPKRRTDTAKTHKA